LPANYGSLPFQEQIAFYRDKVNLPTAAWTDIWEGMHSRAFVVAGAMKADLLTDLRGAVDKAISQGTTLQQFRKDFDQVVATHGWAYNGGRGWRTRVIYDTNLRQSYNAGRYQQMQQVTRTRPYWRYRHNDSVEHPRPEHQAWDSKILRHDDPWWDTHYPQNAWGCHCFVETLSDRDLKRLGKDGPDEAPPIVWEEKTVGTRGPSPRTVQVPQGIDPGFAYNPGKAAWGQQLSEDAMNTWRAQGRDAWETLTPGVPATYGRPAHIPFDKPKAKLGRHYRDQDEVVAALREQLGGEEKVYNVGGMPVLINAEALGSHIDVNRSEFLPLLEDALADPFEVWTTFERHKGSGRYVLRLRIIKAVALPGRADKGLTLVANASRGMLEALTFIPMSRVKEIQKRRQGMLIYGRKN
jgi:hypothetical protein